MAFDQMMIDIETLGNDENAVIAAIGYCMFNVEESKLSKARLFIIDLYQKGRTVDQSTLQWWINDAPQKARDVVFNTPTTSRTSLEQTLKSLKQIIDYASPIKKFWAHGAFFDYRILQHAFDQYEIEVPWTLHQVKDTQGYLNPEVLKPDLAHIADLDCIETLKKLFEALEYHKWMIRHD